MQCTASKSENSKIQLLNDITWSRKSYIFIFSTG